MSEPTLQTIKRLFALSKNQCAYPDCRDALIRGAGTVVADVAHIKAQSPKGLRYDPSQNDVERHAFENLMLLCPNHHRVIDDEKNLTQFPVDVLLEMKSKHELSPGEIFEASDEVAATVLQNYLNVNIGNVGDYSVVSIGQLGGQTAYNITNIGPQPRVLSDGAKANLANRLRQFPSQGVRICAVHGDAEAMNFALQIASVFADAGWTYDGVPSRMYHVPAEWLRDRGLNETRDITVKCAGPTATPEMETVAQWVHGTCQGD